MASLANKDEAEKCRDMARKFLERGDSEKATRFFEKSLKLYPLPGVESLRDVAKSQRSSSSAQNGGGGAAAAGGTSNGKPSPSSPSPSSTAGRSPPPPPPSPRTAPSSSSNSSNQQQQRSAPSSSSSRSAPFSSTNGTRPGSEQSSRANGGAPPGVRRRPSATAASGGGAGSTAAASAGGSGGSGRAFTEEQERAVKEVLASKAKGHYAVLGVEKGAKDDAIKKAYRKLALRFHPDKNGAPKAHEAFQAIGNAFAVLSDEEKRAHYDRFGDDDGPQGIGGGGFGGGGGPFGRHGPYRGADVSPEDIFNMFFGNPPAGGGVRRRGGGGGGPFRVYTAGGGMRNAGAQNGGGGAAGGGSPMNLLTLVPFIVFMLLSLFGGGQQEAIFSFHKTPKFNTVKVTGPNGGVEGIKYYVAPKFRQQYANNREQLRRVELQVTTQYESHLRHECVDLQQRLKARLQQAKRKKRYMDSEAFDQLVRETETMPLPACEEYKAKFS